MPALYPVTVYFYTGFNAGNVPAEASILENATHKDYDAVFKFQSRNNAAIRLNAEWSEIKDADYLKLDVAGDLPVYYVVNQVTMLSAKTAELTLTMDPLLSCGGVSALTVIDGWESRSHVGASEDGLFENVLPEPWVPMNVLQIKDDPQIIHDMEASDTMTIVGSTVDLQALTEYKAELLEVAENPDANVVIPKLPMITRDHFTTVELLGKEYTLPSIGLYFYGVTDTYPVLRGVAAARQIGVESAITSAYVLSRDDIELTPYVPETTTPYVWPYVKIAGVTKEYNAASAYMYGTVKNKKAIALYNTYTILSAASASMAEFEASEIYNNDNAPVFRVAIDPAPGGTAYAQPKTYEGKPVQFLEHSVAGMPWLNSGMAMEGASGGALTMANAGRVNKLVDHNHQVSLDMHTSQATQQLAHQRIGEAEGILGAIGSGLTGDIGGVLGGASRAATASMDFDFALQQADIRGKDIDYQATYQMGDNMFTAQASANVQAPEIRFPVTVNAAAYTRNAFYVYHIGLSDNDLSRFDKFLTMYGYAVDRPLDKTHMMNREHYNYIKTTDAHFTAPAVSATMLTQLSNMLNRGVRIWHELPNAAAYNDNPAKEGT